MAASRIGGRFAAVAVAALSPVLLLSACSSGSTLDSSPGSGSVSAGFPVTVDTAYGELAVGEKPTRIIALTAQTADTLASLGLAAVATAADGAAGEEQFLDLYPWLEGVDIGELDPDLVTTEYVASLEAIAAYEPDLILGNTWQVDEELYEQISQIAPTYVGAVVGNNDWSVQLEDIAELTGESEAAAAAVESVDAAYAAARESLPGAQGKTYSSLRFDGDSFVVGNGSWFDGFGLVPADYQDNTQTSDPISLENIAELSSDVMAVWFYQGSYDELSQDPRFAELPSAINGAVLDIDLPLANAANSAGPLSLVYAIERVTPTLEASSLGGE